MPERLSGRFGQIQDLFCYLFVVKYYDILGRDDDYALALRKAQLFFRDTDYDAFLDELNTRADLWGDLDEDALNLLRSIAGKQMYAQRDRIWSAFTLTGVPEVG